MALVIQNVRLAHRIYRLTVQGSYSARMGQFFMLRCWDAYPVLSRPISVHNLTEDSVSFLYRVQGTGTWLLSALQAGDKIQLEGPFGQGFPKPQGRTALVGGGIGVAPLLLAAKEIPEASVYLGYAGVPFGINGFHEISRDVTVKSGGTIVDAVDPSRYDTIFACGPVGMMRSLAQKAEGTDAKLHVSIEKRMGCGIGACNSCTLTAAGSNRKACTDGPVFLAKEVNWNDLHRL